jgi:hypothetical protein
MLIDHTVLTDPSAFSWAAPGLGWERSEELDALAHFVLVLQLCHACDQRFEFFPTHIADRTPQSARDVTL